MTQLQVDQQFIARISSRLDGFSPREKKDNSKFRCPFCPPSKKRDKGNVYKLGKKGSASMRFQCFVCRYHVTFGEFLKRWNEAVHREYIAASYPEDTYPTAKSTPEQQLVPAKQFADIVRPSRSLRV